MPNLSEAWETLLAELSQTAAAQEEPWDEFYGIIVVDESSSSPADDLESHISGVLQRIAQCLGTALTRTDKACVRPILAVLAAATRTQPIWRDFFGRTGRLANEQATSQSAQSPSCPLKVAVNITASDQFSTDEQLLQPALRIVANCAAENEINKLLVVHGGGIRNLKRLAFQRRQVALVIPTIYNICVPDDVDEDAEEVDLDKKTNSDFVSSPAESQLGEYNDFAANSMTTVELLLGLASACDESLHGLLAELIAVATRPAMAGIEHILGPDLSQHPAQIQQTLASFFSQARVLQQEDEAHAIIRACLTLATPTSSFVMRDHLFDFVDLCCTLDGDSDIDSLRTAATKLIYSMSALPGYAALYSPDTANFSKAIERYQSTTSDPDSPSHIIEALTVLIANALTTPTTIDQALALHSDLPTTLGSTLHHPGPSIPIIPTTDLLTRLALRPTGQQTLLSTPLLTHLTPLLQQPTTRAPQRINPLPIHRALIPLIRLLIKSHPLTSSQLISLPTLHTEILTLSTTTPDATTKAEIARYTIEILRCMSAHSTPDPPIEIADPKFVKAVLYPLLEPTTPAGKAEGLFGLGLLLALVAGRQDNGREVEGVLKVVEGEWRKVEGVLREIVDVGEHADGRSAERKADYENARIVVVWLGRMLKRGSGASAGEQVDDLAELTREVGELAGMMGVAEDQRGSVVTEIE